MKRRLIVQHAAISRLPVGVQETIDAREEITAAGKKVPTVTLGSLEVYRVDEREISIGTWTAQRGDSARKGCGRDEEE